MLWWHLSFPFYVCLSCKFFEDRHCGVFCFVSSLCTLPSHPFFPFLLLSLCYKIHVTWLVSQHHYISLLNASLWGEKSPLMFFKGLSHVLFLIYTTVVWVKYYPVKYLYWIETIFRQAFRMFLNLSLVWAISLSIWNTISPKMYIYILLIRCPVSYMPC